MGVLGWDWEGGGRKERRADPPLVWDSFRSSASTSSRLLRRDRTDGSGFGKSSSFLFLFEEDGRKERGYG